VRAGDWECPNKECKANVFASRDTCYKCNTPKPASGGGQTRGRSPSKKDDKPKNKNQRPDSPAPRREAAAGVPAVVVTGGVTENTQYALPAPTSPPVCDQWELTGKCDCDEFCPGERYHTVWQPVRAAAGARAGKPEPRAGM
jgi:hypothetical protein